MTVDNQEILKARTDEEALAEAVRCCPILYNKRMREFKDQKKKENAPLRMSRIRLFPLLFQNGCSQSSRFPTADQGERGSGKEIVPT